MEEKRVPTSDETIRAGAESPLPEGIAQQELLAAIIENAPIPIFLKDPDSVYLYVNEAFVAAVTHTRDELLGKTDVDLYPEEMASAYRSEDRVAMDASTPIQSTWAQMVGGELRTYRTIKFPIYGARAQVLGVCGISLDLTDTLLEQKRRAEERSRDVAAKPFGRLLAALTPQEERVAELLLLGLSDKKIAETLHLTPDTVRHHVSHILRKLRKPSRTQAVIAMLRHRKRG